MHCSSRALILLALGSLAGAIPAGAQQKQGPQPRPLAGSPPHTVERYPSVQSYLQAHPATGSLWSRTVKGAPAQPVALPRATTAPTLVRTDGQPAGLKPLPTDGSLRIERAPNGSVRWLRLQPGSLNSKGTPTQTALAALESERGEMRLTDPVSELHLTATETDALGSSHLRYEQFYAGIPIWNRDLYVHLDAQGQPYLINGSYEPTPTGDVQLTAALSEGDALVRVESALRTAGRWNPVPAQVADRVGLSAPTTELVLYPTAGRGLRLAYDVTLHPNLIEWVTVVVDAATGETLTQIDRHCSLNPNAPLVSAPTVSAASLQPAADPTGTLAGAFGNGSGTDLNGKTQQFRVWNNGSGTAYSLWDFGNFNLAGSQLPEKMAGGSTVLSAENHDQSKTLTLAQITSTNGTWTERAGVSASVNAKIAYDYYKSTFGRKAIDDKDEYLISVIHVTNNSQSMDNAYWNGRQMIYGDGATAFKPLAGGLDVAGHEMTHGVVQNTANLVYQDQPGALNESFADVFGVMIDRGNLTMGEEIMQPGKGIALRDLENPANPNVLSPQPATMAQYNRTTQDNGGVHINSGIPNNAAARIIKAIGREKTEQIYYRALSKYLTRNSQFIDCRNGIEQAATDLHGANSAEVAAVRAAFDAVGITAGSGTPPPGNDVPPVTGGVSSVAFRTASGAIGTLNMTTGVASLYPNAKARVSQNGTEGSQLSAPDDGGRIWYIDPSRHLSAIDTRTGVVGSFSTVKIAADGDLWNVAISPDENYAVIVSAYDNDPTLYIFNGQSLSEIALLPETSQQGIQDHSIQYPDAISWSPNNSQPKIAFDAYSVIQIGNVQTDYWSMYEIDFARSKIYGLVSAQPDGVNIGNIVYSHTNPDLIAFNVFESGSQDVYLANFDTGEQGKLDLPSYQVTDSERPSFSPDDRKLVMARPATQSLLFYDLTANSNALSGVTFNQPLYSPHWFVIGGTVAVEDRADSKPSDFRLLPAAPNPFNPTTAISYQLSTVSQVKLEIFDALGRRVHTLVDETKSAGAYTATFDAAGLPSGMYLARLTAGGRSLTQRLTLLR